MKIMVKKQETGSTLVVTLVVAFVLGIAICSYLTLLSSRNKIAMRSTAWNTAIPAAEQGIEEALAHLHADPAVPAANGWITTNVAGQMGYWKRRTNSDGSFFFTTIYNYTSNNPTIYSAGFIPAPLGHGDYISRLVRVLATNSPGTFNKNIAAGGSIGLSGGAVIDGYNSSNGPYNTGTNRNAAGGLVSNTKLAKGIDVGTAHVYGTVATGPGGTVNVGSSGAVGDVAWNASHTGVEPGWTNNNGSIAFTSNSPPTGSPVTPTITSTAKSNIMYLSTGLYMATNVTSSDSTKPIIVTGNATLWVKNDFTVSGSGYVYIAPGASLTLYIGDKGTVSGGGVVNGTGIPANMSLIGLPTCNTLDYSGSADFVGTINAPQADVTVSGGADVYGAVICGTFTSSGGSGVHYDQALAGPGGLVVIGWTEL